MKLLLDTQVLLWAAGQPERLSPDARRLLSDPRHELPITSDHAVSVDSLPALHKDPFDRLLLAQALCEGITLVTADSQLAKYEGPIRRV